MIIILDGFYKFFKVKLFILSKVILYIVGWDFKMFGYKVGLVSIVIGL